MKNNPHITSKERVLLALAHRETDRVPFSLGFGINLPARKSLAGFLGMRSLTDLDAYLKDMEDIRRPAPDYTGPSDRNMTDAGGESADIWGVRRKAVSYGEGAYEEISYYPLGEAEDINDLDRHTWPSVSWWNTDSFPDKIRQADPNSEKAILIGVANIFETSWYMRGLEQMFMDLIQDPELAWEIMQRVTEYYIGYYKCLLQSAEGMTDIVFTADDIGQQEGLLMSPVLWEKMIKPHHVRLNRELHEFGVKIMYHTDGAVMEAIPGLVDMGIDILEALQFDAKGMDPAIMKKKFGSSLCFHGGISVQKTLPLGTPEEVRAEVRERKTVLGRGGGYILAPSHAIQAGTPAENTAAFLDEALK